MGSTQLASCVYSSFLPYNERSEDQGYGARNPRNNPNNALLTGYCLSIAKPIKLMHDPSSKSRPHHTQQQQRSRQAAQPSAAQIPQQIAYVGTMSVGEAPSCQLEVRIC